MSKKVQAVALTTIVLDFRPLRLSQCCLYPVSHVHMMPKGLCPRTPCTSTIYLHHVSTSLQDFGAPSPIPEGLRRAIAVYEAGKALAAYISPEYEAIARVSVCPYNVVTGYTLFVEDEARTAGEAGCDWPGYIVFVVILALV